MKQAVVVLPLTRCNHCTTLAAGAYAKALRSCAIRMYAGDHGEPHFHVETPEDRCAVSIRTLTVLAGHVRQRVLREALAWAATHREFLLAKWKDLNR